MVLTGEKGRRKEGREGEASFKERRRMWNPKGHIEKQGGRGIVAVAIDRDKGSQHALRWATERLLTKGQTVVLIHVLKISPTSTFLLFLYLKAIF